MVDSQSQECSDSARSVIDKTLDRLKGQLPETVLQSLRELVPKGKFFETKSFLTALHDPPSNDEEANGD
jgi:hypothetical protein